MSFVQKHLGNGGGFGHDLRELRELRGFRLEDLSAITKIHASVLSALEEERLDNLTDPRYAERHVRAIVLALEGRPAYFLKKYRDLLDARQTMSPESFGIRRVLRRRDFFVTSRVVAFIGFLLVVAAAAAYLIWQGHVLQNTPSLIIQSPQEGLRLSTPHVEVRGMTDPSARVVINGRSAVVDREGRFFLSLDVPRGLTTITIEARRRYGASIIETRRVTYQRPDADLLKTSTLEWSVATTTATGTRR